MAIVNVGSTITVSAHFLDAAGAAANYNVIIWSFISVDGGLISIDPGLPPSDTGVIISGTSPGNVTLSASPDTNQSLSATFPIQILEAATDPASGTITSP